MHGIDNSSRDRLAGDILSGDSLKFMRRPDEKVFAETLRQFSLHSTTTVLVQYNRSIKKLNYTIFTHRA